MKEVLPTEIMEEKLAEINDTALACLKGAFAKGYEAWLEEKDMIYKKGYDAGKQKRFEEDYKNANTGYVKGFADAKAKYEDKTYFDGFEDGKNEKVELIHSTEVDKARKEGMEVAWELAKNLYQHNLPVEAIFNSGFSSVISNLSVKDALNKVQKYEVKKDPNRKDCLTCRYSSDVSGYCNDNCSYTDYHGWKPKLVPINKVKQNTGKGTRSCKTCKHDTGNEFFFNDYCVENCVVVISDTDTGVVDYSAWEEKGISTEEKMVELSKFCKSFYYCCSCPLWDKYCSNRRRSWETEKKELLDEVYQRAVDYQKATLG